MFTNVIKYFFFPFIFKINLFFDNFMYVYNALWSQSDTSSYPYENTQTLPPATKSPYAIFTAFCFTS